MSKKHFTVAAGKYEANGERSCKHCGDFDTFEEALAWWQNVKDYPWAELLYFQGMHDGYLDITPR